MLEPKREYFIKDGAALHSWEFDSSWTKGRKTVYEVMRVINGVPLFLDQHINRLQDSAQKAGMKDIPPAAKIMDSVQKLIVKNSKDDGNILFCIIPNKDHSYILSWFVEHHYPGKDDYASGVQIRTMKAMRKQPDAKIWNAELRSKAQHLISSSEAYEVLLVDRKKNITEGSRSNIFFIRGNALYTTPERKVLQGITRRKVIELCEKMGTAITETEIAQKDLPFYEAAFITGTSPGILPVRSINEHRFNVSNEMMHKLMAAYNTHVLEATISNL